MLEVPLEYKKGEPIFTYYYKKGLQEYEEQKSNTQKAATGGIGVIVLGWLARRLYIAKKMIS